MPVIDVVIIFDCFKMRKSMPDVPPSLPEKKHDKEGDGRVGLGNEHVTERFTTISFIHQNFIREDRKVEGIHDDRDAQQEPEDEEYYTSIEIFSKDEIVQSPVQNFTATSRG